MTAFVGNDNVTVRDLNKNGEVLYEFQYVKSRVYAIAIADSGIIAYGGGDNKVTVRDLNKNGEVLYEFRT